MTYTKEELEKMAELSTADWEPYFGNNHLHFFPPDVTVGGRVSFKRHLGQPLNQCLWEDLVHRLCITGLCIYRPNMGQWTLGWGSKHCLIQLDENGKVEDISFFP